MELEQLDMRVLKRRLKKISCTFTLILHISGCLQTLLLSRHMQTTQTLLQIPLSSSIEALRLPQNPSALKNSRSPRSLVLRDPGLHLGSSLRGGLASGNRYRQSLADLGLLQFGVSAPKNGSFRKWGPQKKVHQMVGSLL